MYLVVYWLATMKLTMSNFVSKRKRALSLATVCIPRSHTTDKLAGVYGSVSHRERDTTAL